MDVIEEFNKLRQSGEVRAYQRRFEELRSLMINHNPHLLEAYFISSFTSGLSDELRLMDKMLSPRTIEQVAESSQLQEMVMEALMRSEGNNKGG